MSRRRARLSVSALASLLAGHSEATCLNTENTSLPESTPTQNYSVLPDGTLAAPATGLMWKRCLEGQTLTDGVCEGTPTIYSWADALGIAHSVTFAGHSDWRLPNPKELLSIFEDRCASPGLNADLFPISGNFGLWTTTPADIFLQDVLLEAWLLNFNGVLMRKSPNTSIPVLLVRDLP